jgi:hypothetical protein
VLHLDDIASHDELFAWTERLLTQVIEPFRRGETAHYTPYDWRARRFGPPRPLPAAPVVLVEGVGAGRRVLRPHLAHLLWMELAHDEAWTRGRQRGTAGVLGPVGPCGTTALRRGSFPALRQLPGTSVREGI